MKWNNDKSITLSLWVTRLFMLLFLAIAVGAYWIINWYVEISSKQETLTDVLLISTYACSVPAGIALCSLNKVLTNLRKKIIFDGENTKMLRILSWCCVVAGLFSMYAGVHYYPIMIISIGAFFMALIVRVVKNCFEVAVEIKKENDMTI